MRNLFFLLLFLSIITGCTNSKKNIEQDFMLEYNSEKLEKAGQVLYSRFCFGCHSSKGSTDNFLVGNILNDYYDVHFLIAYVNRQDSLLKHKNELALKLKETYNDNIYIHQFDLTEQEVKAIVYYLKN
ncbi:MAG TPA: cytochrome c [Flavobacterium sp.]|nr:cytochrome c [Flavobacterium sp.]